jgi:hypothetical protein
MSFSFPYSQIQCSLDDLISSDELHHALMVISDFLSNLIFTASKMSIPHYPTADKLSTSLSNRDTDAL